MAIGVFMLVEHNHAFRADPHLDDDSVLVKYSIQ